MPDVALIKVLCSRRMIVALVMGFSSGLPLLLTISVLQAWMKDEGVDLSVIGLMALVGLPYTLKFLWSPLFDRFTPKFLGRRRGWMLITQLCLVVSILLLSMTEPGKSPWMVAFAALLITFFSASQDIVIDAYRREDLPDLELGLGSSLAVNGYRIGMLLASGGGLILADYISFAMVYQIMALCMLPGIITTYLTPEPPTPPGTPTTMKDAIILPLTDYFRREGAWWILTFILLYKVGDTMASAISTPFYLETGFSKSEIGSIVKLFGFWATIGGAFFGGLLIIRLGIYRSLWFFGILQALSTAGFAALHWVGPHLSALTAVITFENLSGGLGTAAYVAFMASLTDKRFTATQYALLSSLMGIPRVFVSAPTGYLVEGIGWGPFFIGCTLIAIPGLIILMKLKPLVQTSD